MFENIQSKLTEIEKVKFDVIVIGGGATGLGVALDAITRGYKTLLIEKSDYAKATSSRSTKLVHGGVRYLEQGNISLVKSALHEKVRLEKNAPFLVKNCPFIIPEYSYFKIPYYYIGMKLYDILGAANLSHKSRFLSKNKVEELLPNIKRQSLKAGMEYYDAVFDDSRMAITLLRTFLEKGGVALNYTEVTGFLKENNKITAANIINHESSEPLVVKGKCFINATGIFTDSLRQLDEGISPPILKLSQGVHLIINKDKFPGNSALLIPKTKDNRVLFMVPWHNKVICGTTDTLVENATYEPQALAKEVEFILGAAKEYLETSIGRDDVRSVYTGIRPLVMSDPNSPTSRLAREHKIFVSKSGLITIAGGKWTTYRKMAEDTLNQAITEGLLPTAPCTTYNLKMHGFLSKKESLAIPESYRVYGSDYYNLQKMPGFNNKLHPNLDITEAQVEFAIEFEQAKTVDDILARRTRSLFLDAKAALEVAPKVAEIMMQKLKKPKQWADNEVAAFKETANNYLPSSY